MKRTASRTAVAVALALVSAATLSAVSPTAAQAAGGCWSRGPNVDRWFGNGIPAHETYRTWYCYAYRGGNVLEHGVEGKLWAGTSWFVCQKKWVGYENPAVGNARNDWWAYTLSDEEYRSGWGWFPVTQISGGRNWGRLPGRLPDCNTVAGSWVTAGPPTY